MTDGFVSDFKRFFVRGLAVVVPTLVTVWLLITVIRFIDNYMGNYMNTAAQWVVAGFRCVLDRSFENSARYRQEIADSWKELHLFWVGFVLALIAIYIFGRFITSFIGRSVWQVAEATFFRTPVVKQIYPFVKQVTDFLFAQRQMEFSDVVAVEYPRKGIWSVGLLTGTSLSSLKDAAGSDVVTVFIPSSPTPVTGYTITVPKDDIIRLPMSIDDALRFTVSGGVIMPLREQPRENPPASGKQADSTEPQTG